MGRLHRGYHAHDSYNIGSKGSASRPGVGNYDNDDVVVCHEKTRTTKTIDEGKYLSMSASSNGTVSLETLKNGHLSLHVTHGGVDLSVKRTNVLLEALRDFVEGRRFSEKDYGVDTG